MAPGEAGRRRLKWRPRDAEEGRYLAGPHGPPRTPRAPRGLGDLAGQCPPHGEAAWKARPAAQRHEFQNVVDEANAVPDHRGRELIRGRRERSKIEQLKRSSPKRGLVGRRKPR